MYDKEQAERELLGNFIAMIENKWRDKHGIPTHVKLVSATPKEPSET